MKYGCTFNCSVTKDENKDYEIGVHVKDSDGIDIDYSGKGANIDDLLEDTALKLIQDFYDQQDQIKLEKKKQEEKANKKLTDKETIEKLQKIIDDLTSENNSLKTDLSILQKRSDDFMNMNKSNVYRMHKNMNLNDFIKYALF